MSVTRIIGVVNVYNNIAVQSIGFKQYLPIGSPEIIISYLNRWGIDEIIILDIKASLKNEKKLIKKLPDYIKKCHTPVSAGGGVASLKDIENLIRRGADKVVINTQAWENRKIVEEGIKEFGSQAIILAMDVKANKQKYEIFSYSGTKKTDYHLLEALKIAEDLGVGEIFINSIDQDGTKKGFDLKLIKKVKNKTSLPIIICGGVGNSHDFLKAFPYKLSGLAAANFFHYTEHSVISLKGYLRQNEKKEFIRHNSYVNYEKNKIDLNYRPIRRSDNYLENLRFEYVPEEKI